jgi:hypothetical protein
MISAGGAAGSLLARYGPNCIGDVTQPRDERLKRERLL